MQEQIKEEEVCVEIKVTKPKKVYDRTRTKVCCFCGLSIRYDCLARHKLTAKCTIIKNLLKYQLVKIETGQKILIPEVDTNERINKKKIKEKVKKKEVEKRNRLNLKYYIYDLNKL